MSIKTKLLSFFKKEEKPKTRERMLRELTRENLGLLPLDIYYLDDPLLGIPPDRREAYLKKFHDLCEDEEVMEWFKYLINKQVRMTMHQSKDGDSDQSGAVNINGIATVRDTFKNLAHKYAKENVPEEDFNRYQVT